MKKMLVALMAVFVFASCGNSDGGSGNSPVATINNVTSKATTLKDELQKAYDAGDSEKYVQSVVSLIKVMAKMKKELSNVDPSKLPADKLEQFTKKMEEIEKLDRLARATPGFLSQSQLDEIKKAYSSNDAVENAPATTPVANMKLENFGDFFLATADIQNRYAAKVENANDAEAIIAAVEELVNSVVELNNYVAKNGEAMVANGAPDSFGAEGQKYAAASERLRVALNNKCAQVSFTPEQEMRLGQALQRMAGAAQ
jgi:hypothetical protein